MNHNIKSFIKDKFKTFIIPISLLIIGLLFIYGSDKVHNTAQKQQAEIIEERLSDMIDDLNGISESNVMLLTDDLGNVKGAAVICNGGELSENQKSIIDMITSLFGLGASDVFVGGK